MKTTVRVVANSMDRRTWPANTEFFMCAWENGNGGYSYGFNDPMGGIDFFLVAAVNNVGGEGKDFGYRLVKGDGEVIVQQCWPQRG